MMVLIMQVDEQTAAQMLWQVKAIATKEFESLPLDSKQNLFHDEAASVTSEDSYETPDRRKRTVSVESMEMVSLAESSPARFPKTIALIEPRAADSPRAQGLEEGEWCGRRTSDLLDDDDAISASSIGQDGGLIIQKYGKRKRDSFVGLTTKGGKAVRASLRKKFSWKQFPELEGFLIDNQEEYFDFSSRNYTAEQRKYNNSLTRGLLDLAAEEGYVFEEFTFSMVRDRIRCYYKSHSQSAKKKRRR